MNVKKRQTTLMMLMLVRAASQSNEEGDLEHGYELEIYTGIVMILTLSAWLLMRYGMDAISVACENAGGAEMITGRRHLNRCNGVSAHRND